MTVLRTFTGKESNTHAPTRSGHAAPVLAAPGLCATRPSIVSPLGPTRQSGTHQQTDSQPPSCSLFVAEVNYDWRARDPALAPTSLERKI
jgi:hypothetical protein